MEFLTDCRLSAFVQFGAQWEGAAGHWDEYTGTGRPSL